MIGPQGLVIIKKKPYYRNLLNEIWNVITKPMKNITSHTDEIAAGTPFTNMDWL